MGTEDTDHGETETNTYASIAPKAQREILVHAVLAGLTPLIPLPFVDDWARTGIQTRMVRKIARAHEKQLYESDTKILGKETGRDENLLIGTAKKLAFFPIRRIFRTALFVLILKDIVEVASRTYHVGYLLDYVIGKDLHSTSSSEKLRIAIDDICRQADTSPVRRAFATVFEESKDLLGGALKEMRGWMGNAPKQEDGGPNEEEQPREVEALADRLQRAINVLPPAHFIALREALDNALGMKG